MNDFVEPGRFVKGDESAASYRMAGYRASFRDHPGATRQPVAALEVLLFFARSTRWFERRFAHGGRRMRAIGIVALARRLLIELWRFLKTGTLPDGAIASP